MITVVLVAIALGGGGGESMGPSTPAIYRPVPGCDNTVFVTAPSRLQPPGCISRAAERKRKQLQCGGIPDSTCFAATTSRRGAP
jgi:hypothetical protein